MTSIVRKAVVPAAGLGTRFLPATKAQPKAMLPLVDKPAIQYIVEEAAAAGITDVLVINGRGAQSVEDHFDRAPELERILELDGKTDVLAQVRAPTELVNVHYTRQGEPRGLGHAIGAARAFVGDEPFAVLLPDDLMIDEGQLLTDMIAAYGRHGGSIVAFRDVLADEISAYGCADVDPQPVEDGIVRLRGIVEKPAADVAPSTLAATGRYVFSPAIFACIDRVAPGRNREIQLTDAIAFLLEQEPVFGAVFDKGRFDVGTPIDFLRATVELSVDRPDLGPAFRAFLTAFVRERGLT